MNLYAMPPFFTSLLVFLLGCFVFLKNRKAKPNILFLLLTFAISLWLFSDYVIYTGSSPEGIYIWAKLSYVSVIFIPVFFLHFSLSFLRTGKLKRTLIVAYLLGSILTLTLLLTDQIISGVQQRYWGYYYKVGWLHSFLIVYFGLVLATAFGILYSQSKDKTRPSQERNKIKFLLMAFIVGFVAATDFFPKYGFEFYPLGFAFASMWIFLMGYAIVKHRLFDTQLVISRGMMYALTLFLGILPAALIVFFLQKVFPLTVPITLVLVLAVALAFLFTKIHPFSERFVQRKLFRTQTNYYHILQKFSQDMVTALDLKSLLERFDKTLREAMQVTSVAIYLTGPMNGKYPLTHASDVSGDLIPILWNKEKESDGETAPTAGIGVAAPHHSSAIPLWESGDALVAMAYQAKDVLVLGEMEMMAREKENKRLNEAIMQMKEAKAEVCMPLKRDGKMVGIALLGPREGDRYYSPDDLSLLHTLAQNACVAVQNALMVEEIKRSYQILQRVERLAAMGSLIAGVSHEIRNPLMPISFLMEAVADPAEDKDLLKRLHKYSKESLRRITNVLDEMDELAKPHTPELKKADINTIVNDALLLLDTHVKLKKQEIIKEYASLPGAMVDGTRLKQAIMDILLNAIEANPEGGKICVRTRQIQLKKTKTQPARTGVQIEIADVGCGIEEGNLERVFDPFFTTKHKSLVREGTGLGLALAHRIVEEHHGSIELRSTVGKGTTVFVNLPVNR